MLARRKHARPKHLDEYDITPTGNRRMKHQTREEYKLKQRKENKLKKRMYDRTYNRKPDVLARARIRQKVRSHFSHFHQRSKDSSRTPMESLPRHRREVSCNISPLHSHIQ
jgi:hypothetical protein